MVGDAEGVVCIPAVIADDVEKQAYEQTMYEDWVELQISAGAGLFGVYPLTDDGQREAFAAWKIANAQRYPLIPFAQ